MLFHHYRQLREAFNSVDNKCTGYLSSQDVSTCIFGICIILVHLNSGMKGCLVYFIILFLTALSFFGKWIFYYHELFAVGNFSKLFCLLICFLKKIVF